MKRNKNHQMSTMSKMTPGDEKNDNEFICKKIQAL